jgi:predicted nucleic acid-binding protein
VSVFVDTSGLLAILDAADLHHASFETMKQQGIQQVFTFDRHFAEQGFEALPGSQK